MPALREAPTLAGISRPPSRAPGSNVSTTSLLGSPLFLIRTTQRALSSISGFGDAVSPSVDCAQQNVRVNPPHQPGQARPLLLSPLLHRPPPPPRSPPLPNPGAPRPLPAAGNGVGTRQSDDHSSGLLFFPRRVGEEDISASPAPRPPLLGSCPRLHAGTSQLPAQKTEASGSGWEPKVLSHMWGCRDRLARAVTPQTF